MIRTEKDETREYRISTEAVVDAYDEEKQAMGWYYYLDDKMHFPFMAQCIKTSAKSPLCEDEQVVVMHMAPEDECMHEMFVEIKWKERVFCVPLVQLQPLEADGNTLEAVEDWHYWMARGYKF